jgi:hypothetical protein
VEQTSFKSEQDLNFELIAPKGRLEFLRFNPLLFTLCPAGQDGDLQIVAISYLRAAWLLTANYLDNVAAPPCLGRNQPTGLLPSTLREIESRTAIRDVGCQQPCRKLC